ncbi:hypothetical protein [Mucilaginibacter arboris]|uniref:Uncharacterized protein n=1 Tax=Mucilaginibacter arboris TaxID=2682090 RepID=A0A7K1SX78_9SPHI|nr:hypothetical protein [Mucilaginibacter arboris]MVN21929.1 hypothetical protein [Mucilaginibacter arboris]
MAFSFNTAPKVISDKFTKLAKEGRLADILEAVYDERSNNNAHSLTGTSKNGAIKVVRIGSFSTNGK